MVTVSKKSEIFYDLPGGVPPLIITKWRCPDRRKIGHGGSKAWPLPGGVPPLIITKWWCPDRRAA